MDVDIYIDISYKFWILELVFTRKALFSTILIILEDIHTNQIQLWLNLIGKCVLIYFCITDSTLLLFW